jgi:drug/metabolite transporter (DMT)-like permease
MSISNNLQKREVDFALLLVAALWGGSYLAAKVLTEHTTVTALLAIRFSITSIAMAVIWIIKKPAITKEIAVLGLSLGTIQALILFLETSGVAKTSATNAGLIISLCIVFTPILESLASKQWLPRSFFIATTTAVVGVALLVSKEGFATPNIGDWLMLGAATVRSIHVTSMGHLTKGKNYSSISITLLQSLACAFLFLVFSFKETIHAISNFQSAQWLGMLYLSILAGAFSFLLTLWGIRLTSSSRASLLLGTEPVWAVVVGVSLGGEKLGLIGIIGAVLIVGSTYIGQQIEQHSRTNGAN